MSATENKKADVRERPEAFPYVGLLFNEPLSLCRAAFYLVIRQTQVSAAELSRNDRAPAARHKPLWPDGARRTMFRAVQKRSIVHVLWLARPLIGLRE